MTWTRFYDMHSGGEAKTAWEIIYAEGDEETARKIVAEALSIDTEAVTCSCCGEDFSVLEFDSLEDAASLDGRTVAEFLDDPWVEQVGRRLLVLVLGREHLIASR